MRNVRVLLALSGVALAALILIPRSSEAEEYGWGLCSDPATHPGSGTEAHRNGGFVSNNVNFATYWVHAGGSGYPSNFWADRNCDTGEWVGPW